MLFGVGVSCRILSSIVSYMYVSCNGSITSVGEERINLSAIMYSERFPLPLGAWNWMRYFIGRHSLRLSYNYFALWSERGSFKKYYFVNYSQTIYGSRKDISYLVYQISY